MRATQATCESYKWKPIMQYPQMVIDYESIFQLSTNSPKKTVGILQVR